MAGVPWPSVFKVLEQENGYLAGIRYEAPHSSHGFE
jgi:hypothetical protein